MGLFDIFKKNRNDNNCFVSDIKYKGVSVVIELNIEESKKYLLKDYKVLESEGIECFIKKQLISWLKGNQFDDMDDDKIYKGLKIYSISYYYGKIIDKYSPTGKEDYFGQFQFVFESSNRYTEDLLEAAAMEIYVLDNKIVKVKCYDV